MFGCKTQNRYLISTLFSPLVVTLLGPLTLESYDLTFTRNHITITFSQVNFNFWNSTTALINHDTSSKSINFSSCYSVLSWLSWLFAWFEIDVGSAGAMWCVWVLHQPWQTTLQISTDVVFALDETVIHRQTHTNLWGATRSILGGMNFGKVSFIKKSD